MEVLRSRFWHDSLLNIVQFQSGAAPSSALATTRELPAATCGAVKLFVTVATISTDAFQFSAIR